MEYYKCDVCGEPITRKNAVLTKHGGFHVCKNCKLFENELIGDIRGK
jgi:formylmethanofuran dehydrogenase subunit E